MRCSRSSAAPVHLRVLHKWPKCKNIFGIFLQNKNERASVSVTPLKIAYVVADTRATRVCSYRRMRRWRAPSAFSLLRRRPGLKKLPRQDDSHLRLQNIRVILPARIEFNAADFQSAQLVFNILRLFPHLPLKDIYVL